jgi:hypothetical protein
LGFGDDRRSRGSYDRDPARPAEHLLEGERYPNDLLLTYDQVEELAAPHAPPPQQLAAQLPYYPSARTDDSGAD